MELALVFIVVAVVWLTFRKWIAREQYRIATQMLGQNSDGDERRVKAVEHAGILFSVLLLLAGVALVILHTMVGR
jgi:hypothetical protein